MKTPSPAPKLLSNTRLAGLTHIYRNHPLRGNKLRRRGWGSVVGYRKLCCGGVFPSPGGCLRASVNDGTYVRCHSEVPVIVRFRIRESKNIIKYHDDIYNYRFYLGGF